MKAFMVFTMILACIVFATAAALAGDLTEKPRDLPELLQAGVIRHLGIPYANFVTGSGDGLDVEMMQLFARHLGVEYEYVASDWSRVIPDLIGHEFERNGAEVRIVGEAPIKGDVIANGMTMLAWRAKLVEFSDPMFPTQIWVIVAADTPIEPIIPAGDVNQDIAAVRRSLRNHSVLCKPNTCLDPSLYNMDELGAEIRLFYGNLNHLAPAVLNREAEATILDVPDALVALRKWAGKIKVVGPMSPLQEMGAAFPKTSVELRQAFNAFLAECRQDGTYLTLVKKYYPAVFQYYPDYFQDGTPAMLAR